jgi:hypothetical protein
VWKIGAVAANGHRVVLIEVVQTTMRRADTMAERVSMALAELVRKAEQQGDVDFLREGVRVLSQALMEVEVAEHLGVGRHERTTERTG